MIIFIQQILGVTLKWLTGMWITVNCPLSSSTLPSYPCILFVHDNTVRSFLERFIFNCKDEEDVYGEEAKGEEDADDDDEDEGQEAEGEATLRANVRQKCVVFIWN